MRGSGEGTWAGWPVLVCTVLLLSACRDPARASGTALYVTTEFDPTLLLTQVRVWGSVEGGDAFGPHVLPEQPERLLYSGETLRVLLGDVANGVQAKVFIEGLRNDVVVARGEGGAQVRDGYEVEVTLQLEPISEQPNGTPDGGTFCIGCDGCCVQGHCTGTTFNTCGTGGIACVTCDPARADACDSRGVCVCGTNPACNEPGADRCVNGQCRCGSGAACAPGQECVDGACRCTANSCSGCCSGNTCEAGNTQSRCGKGGEACVQCKKGCNADHTCR
ncbi:hypothetical protein DAT35_31265 [Vitiosangium sp. GDMCC 1.1324]|nr:hypothetical protein DAT35_31265 [Vitiosangium sp. GDMCC 1.1324]